MYLASRLSHTGVETHVLAYLELLGRAVSDLHLDPAERRQLNDFANELGLSDAHIAQAHRRYLNDLTDAAVADGEVTLEEYGTLVRIASALGIDQKTVETRVHPFRTNESAITLTAGMHIVFTGDHPQHERHEVTLFAGRLGLIVQTGVSKTTALVAAADPESNSGKAGKARRYGIPIISIDDLMGARLGDAVAGHGAGQAALKVISCPDCHTTWTVPATSAERAAKRCLDCASVTTQPPREIASKEPVDIWAPPIIEWLTCETCAARWHRQVVRGRKPRQCHACVAGTA